MVDVTDAPPERLYRPDLSLTAWRSLADREYAAKLAAIDRPASPDAGRHPDGEN